MLTKDDVNFISIISAHILLLFLTHQTFTGAPGSLINTSQLTPLLKRFILILFKCSTCSVIPWVHCVLIDILFSLSMTWIEVKLWNTLDCWKFLLLLWTNNLNKKPILSSGDLTWMFRYHYCVKEWSRAYSMWLTADDD